MKKFLILLTCLFVVISCGENRENKIVKRIENCADKAFYDKVKFKGRSVSKSISNKEKFIKDNEEKIEFLIEEQNFFSSKQAQKDHAVDKHLIKKKMGEKKYLYTDYAQSLGYAFDVLPSYTKKNITEQERENLRNKTKKRPSTKYMLETYEETLAGFDQWINYYKKQNDDYRGEIKKLNSKEGLKEFKNEQSKKRKEHNDEYLNFLKRDLKKKLNYSLYNNKFIACEQIRQKAKIAFDEKWK